MPGQPGHVCNTNTLCLSLYGQLGKYIYVYIYIYTYLTDMCKPFSDLACMRHDMMSLRK